MLFLKEILSFKTAFGQLWLAGTMGVKCRPFSREYVRSTNIADLCEAIFNVKEPLAPRLSGTFLLGLCSIFRQKQQNLHGDALDMLKKVCPISSCQRRNPPKAQKTTIHKAVHMIRDLDLDGDLMNFNFLQNEMFEEFVSDEAANEKTIYSQKPKTPTPKKQKTAKPNGNKLEVIHEEDSFDFAPQDNPLFKHRTSPDRRFQDGAPDPQDLITIEIEEEKHERKEQFSKRLRLIIDRCTTSEDVLQKLPCARSIAKPNVCENRRSTEIAYLRLMKELRNFQKGQKGDNIPVVEPPVTTPKRIEKENKENKENKEQFNSYDTSKELAIERLRGILHGGQRFDPELAVEPNSSNNLSIGQSSFSRRSSILASFDPETFSHGMSTPRRFSRFSADSNLTMGGQPLSSVASKRDVLEFQSLVAPSTSET